MVLNTNNRLMQVKSIAECSKGSILQYVWPSLSYGLSLRFLFFLFLSGRLRQVLLYIAFLFTCLLIEIKMNHLFYLFLCHVKQK